MFHRQINKKIDDLTKRVDLNTILLSSKVSSASNVGIGNAQIFASKVENDLRFRSLLGTGDIILKQMGDTITIGVNAIPGGVTQEYTDASFGQRDNKINAIDASLSTFSTVAYVNQQIALIPKPDVNKSYVDAELAKKADLTSLDNYATKSYVNTAVANVKPDVTKLYVDGSLANRDLVIALKTDKTYVDTGLTAKADKTYVDQQIASVPKADVTKFYVDGSLAKRDSTIALKADKTYVDQKFVNDNSTGFIYYEFQSGPITANTSKQLVHGKKMVGKYFVNARNIDDTNNVSVQLLRISLTNGANAVEIKSPVDISNLIIQIMGKSSL